LRADYVGRQQVRRELDALEGQMQSLGKGAHVSGLGQARHAFEQDVAGRSRGRPASRWIIAFADDDLGDCFEQGIEPSRAWSVRFVGDGLVGHA